jgi:hypothetical protein
MSRHRLVLLPVRVVALVVLVLVLAHRPVTLVPAESPSQVHEATLMQAYGCSTTGLPHTIPGGALVRQGETTVHTSFDAGWAVYEGHAPGVLVAVCLR